MITREQIEEWYQRLLEQLRSNELYADFINLKLMKSDAKRFTLRVCKAHLRSPQVLGFVFSITPPKSRNHIEHNLLEELGYEDEGEPSHPDLLKKLAFKMGVTTKEWDDIEAEAELVIRNKAIEPLMFGTLLESGLNVMLEVFAFEWMLAREANKMGRALQHYLELKPEDLEWFFHHSEVDIAHAEQGLDTLVDLLKYYQMDHEAAKTVAEITFRENIFLKRYFDLQIPFKL
jgi:pyrroloquinoline quinone (PQQ) biosynthesis protein C